MNISILGAGWLGLPLGKALAREGHEVKGSTTSEDKLDAIQQAGMEPYLIDLDREGELPPDFFQADLLIITLPPGRRDPEVRKNYDRRIQKVIQAVRKSPIQYLIYTSSTGVYGDREGEVREETPVAPSTDSSKAVRQAEIDLAKTGLPLTVVRLAGLAGAGRKAGRFLAGRKGLANGEAPVNLVHQDDCIGVIREIIRQSAWNEVFNVCADEHPSRAALYTEQAKSLGLEPPEFVEGKKTKAYKVVGNGKVKKELGYQFKFPDPMEFG